MVKLVMLAAFAFALGMTQVGGDASLPHPIQQVTTSKEVVITIVGFLSLLATHIFAIWRESRQRTWDIEDRKRAREEMKKQAEQQQIETISTAVEIARVSNANRNHIVDLLHQNTRLTEDAGEKASAAYTATLDFNQKLEALRRELQEKAMVTKAPDEESSNRRG